LRRKKTLPLNKVESHLAGDVNASTSIDYRGPSALYVSLQNHKKHLLFIRKTNHQPLLHLHLLRSHSLELCRLQTLVPVLYLILQLHPTIAGLKIPPSLYLKPYSVRSERPEVKIARVLQADFLAPQVSVGMINNPVLEGTQDLRIIPTSHPDPHSALCVNQGPSLRLRTRG